MYRTTRYHGDSISQKENLMKSFLVIFTPALAVVALGVTAAMHGEADDAPGLALLGILLIVGALAVAVRTAQRSSQHPRTPHAADASRTGERPTG
jgi:hypothetical protein